MDQGRFAIADVLDMDAYGGCYRKVPFGKRTDAKRFAARLAGANGGCNGTVYRCGNCGMYHVTSDCKAQRVAERRR